MEKREREVRELKDRHVAASMQFRSGDRCHITQDNGKKVYGEIVAVNVAPPSHANEDRNTKWAQVITFQEGGGGESHVVPYRSITLAGNSSRSSSSNRGQNRTSNQMATTDHTHGGLRQHARIQSSILPLSASQQQHHPAHTGGRNRTNHQPGRSHHQNNNSNQQRQQQQQQQLQPQVPPPRGKTHQQKSSLFANASTSVAPKSMPYAHVTSSAAAATTGSSITEPKHRDQQLSKSRRTVNPPQPPPADSILPLPTPPPINPRNLQIIVESQAQSTVHSGPDGQLRKTKKAMGNKRSTASVAVGPKPSIPQNIHSEVNESPHYYKPDGHYSATTSTTTTSMQKSGPDHAGNPSHQRQHSHQQLVNTNRLHSDGSTSTSGSSDPESPPVHQSKHSIPPHSSSVFFNSYSSHPHKQVGSGLGGNVFANHLPPPNVAVASSRSHTHHTASSVGGDSSYSHNSSTSHPLPVGSMPPGKELSSARQKTKSQSSSRVSRAQPYYLPSSISGGREQQQRQPTSAASMLSESTMYMTSLMGRSFPQDILTQSQLSAITDAPECEWPILNPVGNKNPLHPSLPSSLHIDGPPVNPSSSSGLPVNMDGVNSQSVPMVPFLYTTDPLQILMHEFNPPMHLLHNGGTLESKQQFLFDYAQKCLQVYSKYINDPDLEDVLGDLMCMRLEDFSSTVTDGHLSVCTSYTSRAESEATDLTPMFEPHTSYTNYAESTFFQPDPLQGEGDGADEEEEYEEEEEEEKLREAEQSRQLSTEKKQFTSGLSQQLRCRKMPTPPSSSGTTNSQSPVVVSPKPVDQEDDHTVASFPPSKEQGSTEPATSTSSNELSDNKPSTEEALVSSEEGSAEQSGGRGFPPPGPYHPGIMPPPPMMYPRPPGFPPYYPAPYPMYYPMPGMPFNFSPWMFHPAMIPQMQMMMMPGPFQQPGPPQLVEDPPTAGDKEVQGSLAEESEKPLEGPAARSATQDANLQPLTEEQARKGMLSSQESQSSSQQSSESSGTTISQPEIDQPTPSGLHASSQDAVKENPEQVRKGLPTSRLGLLGSNPSLRLPSLPCRGTQMDSRQGSSKPNLSPTTADYETTSANVVSPDNSIHSSESSGHSQQGKTLESPPLSSMTESTNVPGPATVQRLSPQGTGIRDVSKGRESSHVVQPDGSQQQQRLKRSVHHSGGPYHHYRPQQYGDGVEMRGSFNSHSNPHHNGGQYFRKYQGNGKSGKPYNNNNNGRDRRTPRRNHYLQDPRNTRQPTLRSYHPNQYPQYGHVYNKHHRFDQYHNQRGYQYHSSREQHSSEDRMYHPRSTGDRNAGASSGTGDPGSFKVPFSSSNHSTVVDSNAVL